MSIVIALLSFVLILLCLFVGLVILVQQPKGDAGMGAAIGGGAMESALGAESGNVLTKLTTYCIIAFFCICFLLYLGNQFWKNQNALADQEGNSLDALIESSETGDEALDLLPSDVAVDEASTTDANEAVAETTEESGTTEEPETVPGS